MTCGDLPLDGKIVLVTGGGSGINFSFVKRALKAKALGVVIADLSLTQEAQTLADVNPRNVVFSKCDVTKRQDMENAVTIAQKKFGDVPDVYIAGAGVFCPKWSNWWDDTEEDRYGELDINTTGALKLARIATKALVRRGKKGVVLITASLAGYQGTFACPLYSASKHAVIGFVRSVAALDELEGIKIVAVAPGLVHTPLWTDRPDLQKQFGYDEKHAVSPDFVAENMMKLVTSGEYEGGTCLEVAKETVRTLGTWNIPPPPGVGVGVALPKEVLEQQYAPIRVILDKERQSKD